PQTPELNEDEALYSENPLLDSAEVDAAEANDKPSPKGMRDWLFEQAANMKSLTSTEKAALWRESVQQYQNAKSAEQALRAQVSDITSHIEAVNSARAQILKSTQQRHTHLVERRRLDEE
ncbi:hypothetical protein, partial [Psychrobacter sp. TB20-MNA-CIBAN-0197]